MSCLIFLRKPCFFLFSKEVQKNNWLEIEICCSIISVFTVTFDPFNASLLNKHNHFLKKYLTVPKPLYFIYLIKYCGGDVPSWVSVLLRFLQRVFFTSTDGLLPEGFVKHCSLWSCFGTMCIVKNTIQLNWTELLTWQVEWENWQLKFLNVFWLLMFSCSRQPILTHCG